MVRVAIAILLLAALPALPAAAQGKGKGPPAERGPSASDRGDRSGDRDEWRRFTDSDRRW